MDKKYGVSLENDKTSTIIDLNSILSYLLVKKYYITDWFIISSHYYKL